MREALDGDRSALVLEGLPAILGWLDGRVTGALPTRRIIDAQATAYDGASAAITATLGPPLDVELPGDPVHTPAALIRRRTCAALNRVDRNSRRPEPQCRNGHPLDPDFG